MFYPSKMQKVRIIGANRSAKQMIGRLHELGVVEIRPIGHAEGIDTSRPLGEHEAIATELLRIRAMMNALGIKADRSAEAPGKPLDEARRITADAEVSALSKEMDDINSKTLYLKEKGRLAANLEKGFSGIDFSKLKTRTLDFALGNVTKDKLARLDALLRKEKARYLNSGLDILVVYPKETEAEMEILLTRNGFVKTELPADFTTPAEYDRKTRNEAQQYARRRMEIKASLANLAERYSKKLQGIEKALAIEADRTEIASRFGFTRLAYIIEGWIIAKEFEKLEMGVKGLDPSAVVEKAASDPHHEKAPTHLENPKVAKPFEFLTKTFSLPLSGESDPTLLYFLMVPILYGMIVGDVFYGLLSLIIAFWLKGRFKGEMMQSVCMIWIIGAIPAMIFGVVYDEWLGMSHLHFIHSVEEFGIHFGITESAYQGISREHSLSLVIGLSIIAGLVQLGIGFLLGAVNAWGHSRKHAVGKLAWLLLEIGGTATIMAMMFAMLPAEAGTYGLAALVLSILLIGWSEGIAGILELPGLLGNVLSYARIAAIGVVGVILALIINEMLMPTPEKGIVMMIVLTPIYLALHMANVFLAMFEALIQGGRLNLIEFRLKFIQGGGQEFKPFMLRNEKR